MWKAENYDHQLIQTSIAELDGVVGGVSNRNLLAHSTSYVFENYIRPGEQGVFQCELFASETGVGYEVCQTTLISKTCEMHSKKDLIWAGKVSYFLDKSFIPTLRGHQFGELARRTVDEYLSFLRKQHGNNLR